MIQPETTLYRGQRYLMNPSTGMRWSQDDELKQLEAQRISEANESDRRAGVEAKNYAAQFLSSWNSAKAQTTGMYNTAMADFATAKASVDQAGSWLENIKGITSDVMEEYNNFKTTFRPLEEEAITTSMEALGTERGLMQRIRELSVADYEGVSGRAKADVGFESENARKAEARRLQGLGISPESGRTRSTMNRSFIDEALMKVLAGNKARIGEKNRVTGVATAGLSSIDPSVSGGIATGIRSNQAGLLNTAGALNRSGGELATGLARTRGDLASAEGSLASSYAKDLAQPEGEMFAGMAGAGLGARP